MKRRRRQRKNDTTPSHVVMVITDETVEERKQRLSDEADRADKLARVQAEDQAKERIPDDEETEDEDAFKEQQFLTQARAKRDARVVDRLARLKINRTSWLAKISANSASSNLPRANSPQWCGQLWCLNL